MATNEKEEQGVYVPDECDDDSSPPVQDTSPPKPGINDMGNLIEIREEEEIINTTVRTNMSVSDRLEDARRISRRGGS